MLLYPFLLAFSCAIPTVRALLTVNILPLPSIVASVDDLQLEIEVTNTWLEDVAVFKHGSVLDGSAMTKAFHVTKNGSEVAFQGIQASL